MRITTAKNIKNGGFTRSVSTGSPNRGFERKAYTTGEKIMIKKIAAIAAAVIIFGGTTAFAHGYCGGHGCWDQPAEQEEQEWGSYAQAQASDWAPPVLAPATRGACGVYGCRVDCFHLHGSCGMSGSAGYCVPHHAECPYNCPAAR